MKNKNKIYSGRNKKLFVILILFIFISQFVAINLVSAATYRTPNFIINTADPKLAEAFGKAAERYRHDLAIDWAGEAMPNWGAPCFVTIQVGPNLGAGGATTFMFNRGEVYGWRMNIQVSAERVLDSVLPHEITHMIFASYFRQPLPRWADEGGATSVEASVETAKHDQMLKQFMTPNPSYATAKNPQGVRTFSFNDLFAMKEYPQDIMPLYAEGYSLAKYLIQLGGRQKYVQFLSEGMKNNDWNGAIKSNYPGFTDIGDLQKKWNSWVTKGSPQLPLQVASSNNPSGSSTGSSGSPIVTTSGSSDSSSPNPNVICDPTQSASSSSSQTPAGVVQSQPQPDVTDPNVPLVPIGK